MKPLNNNDMKISNQPKLNQEIKLLQIALTTTLVLGVLAVFIFTFSGILNSNSSKAATATLNAGSTVLASNDPFASVGDGDTIMIHGKFNLDQDYTLHYHDSIIIIIDGANAEMKLFPGYKLKLGAGSLIYLANGGKVKMQGFCDSTTAIFIGGVMVANCNGDGATSFDDFNNGGGGPLPVEWINVEAKAISEGEVEVSWATATEINNEKFDVEFSADAASWQLAKTVASLADGGNSNEILHYSTTHFTSTLTDRLYYRIKQTDFDGMFDYSDVVVVNFKGQSNVNIATLGDSKIKLSMKTNEGNAHINIYNETGALILSEDYQANRELALPSPGVYIVEVLDGGKVERIKHVVI